MRTGWLLSRASVAHGVAWPAQEEISASAKDYGQVERVVLAWY